VSIRRAEGTLLSVIDIIDFGDAYFTPEITHFRGKDTKAQVIKDLSVLALHP